ncbi:MAG: deoxyribose-phosphate aldolase [Spirochaetota bacterium]
MKREEVAQMLDLSVLRPESTRADALAGCLLGIEHGVKSVIVLPCWIDDIVEALRGSKVLPSVVIGFPFGGETPTTKAASSKDATQRGAVELDMVLSVGKLRDGKKDFVRDDIKGVVQAAKGVNPKAIIKVILETCYLDDAQKKLACHLSEEAGADFVKTSTGFGSKGATVEDIRLMRASVSPKIGVKASGGIRDWTAAGALIAAGANRLGCSNPASILDGMPR